MKRSKGILVVGPPCSGKTQLVKLVTQTLRRAFNITLRSTYLAPSTFTDSELFGPIQAFDSSVQVNF